VRFSVARRTSGNTEYAYRWRTVKQFMLLRIERKRQIRPDRHKACVLRPGIRPAQPIGRHSKNGVVGKIERIAHSVQLHGAAHSIDQASTAKRLGIMKYDSDTRAGFPQHPQNAQEFVRKSARRPRQRRILHMNPCATPGLRLEHQCSKRCSPAMFVPGNAPDLQAKIVRDKRFTKIPAILFNRVSRFVAAAEESDDELRFHVIGAKNKSFAVSVSRAAARGKEGEKQEAAQKVIE
jgi:hypothetical protein